MIRLAILALLGQSPFVVPPPYSPAANGLEINGTGSCAGADSIVYDNNGVRGCRKLTDTAPQDLFIRPQPAFAAGTQTASDVNIFGGQDETKIAIDGADPTVTCAGDNDSVTVTVWDSNGTATATTLTEGTEWQASASVATTCASLASAVDALAGVGATCTSPNVLITMDGTTGQVKLAESTAACTTVDDGTQGVVNIVTQGLSTYLGELCLGPGGSTDPCVYGSAASTIAFNTRGAAAVNITGIATMSAQALNLTSIDADLAAGSCTAGAVKRDTGGATREICVCNAGGTAYDCISVTNANGPSD